MLVLKVVVEVGEKAAGLVRETGTAKEKAFTLN